MTLSLSQSDFVAIAVGVAQIAATFGVAVWTVRTMSPVKEKQPGTKLMSARLVPLMCGLFIALAAYNAYELAQMRFLSHPVSGEQLVRGVVIGISLASNVGAAFLLMVLSRILDLISQLARLGGRLAETQLLISERIRPAKRSARRSPRKSGN